MSNEMIMRVARAISEADHEAEGDYRKLARAAIEAIREPTDAMREFHTKYGDLFDWNCNCNYCGGHKFAVQAYIDEALR